jgi:hypothetical protein
MMIVQDTISRKTVQGRINSVLRPIFLWSALLFLACTDFKHDNPFDTAGINWHRPTLSISATPEAWINQTISLNATAYDSNGSISRYLWNIDGVIDETHLSSRTTSFSTSGLKTIIVTAYDNDNVPSENKEIGIRIRDTVPVLDVSTNFISLGTSVSNKTFTISNTGYGSMSWSVASNSTWLSVSPSSGTTYTTASTVTVSVDRSLLTAGSFSGILTVTAGNDSKTIGVSVTNGKLFQVTTLTITNYLLLPVSINVNNTFSMIVSPGSVKTDTVAPGSSMVVTWNLVRLSVDGNPQGELLSASFDAESNPSGNYNYTIDNIIGTKTYFVPVITNKTSTNLIAAVNWDLSDEFRCDGYIPANSTAIQLGYYRLWSNTKVVIFKKGSNFTGNYKYWLYGSQFTSSDVDENSGEVDIATTIAPSLAPNLVP